MKIHAIGDSHIFSFKENDNFIVHKNWAATAFKLGESEHSSRLRVLKILKEENIDKINDIVLLSFGEIDCGLHIYNIHKRDKIPISILIDNTIANYGKMIKEIEKMGFKICIYSIPPSQDTPDLWNLPYFAPLVVRVQIVKEFNEKLDMFCKENNIPFINIFSMVSNKNGSVSSKYSNFPIKSSKDKTHLNKKIVPFVLLKIYQAFKIKYIKKSLQNDV